MKRTVVTQRHHISYDPEVIRVVRKGVHQVITLIRRFRHLTDEEVDTIKLEAELKRTYKEGKNETQAKEER